MLAIWVALDLFPLIQVNNTLDVIYKIFLHRLWESLSTEDIDINDKGLFNLFPSCSTMSRYQLSCEAVFWPKTEKHLCRGQVCNDPKVNPNIEKHYLDLIFMIGFNIMELIILMKVPHLKEISQLSLLVILIG